MRDLGKPFTDLDRASEHEDGIDRPRRILRHGIEARIELGEPMSIAGDLLAAATPTRLICRNGNWTLEVSRLVAVERDLYQPRTQRLHGSDAIISHLRRTSEGVALAVAASALMRGPRGPQECSFEAVENEWLPCEAVARSDSSRPSAPPTSAAAGELRAELFLLRASHDGLRERVARLEAQIAAGRGAAGVFMSSGTPAVKVSEASRGGTDASDSHTRISRASVVPQAGLAQQESVAAQAAARPGGTQVRLPPAAAVSACLHTLIGKKVGVSQLRAVTFSPEGDSPCWLSRLVDDEGKEVGGIVADLLATIGLGGALMMLTPAQLDEQRASKRPSEDVLSAMEEVANNLSATINQQPDGLHVRVRPLEAVTPGALDWTKSAALATAFELADGLGNLFIFIH